MATMVTDTKTIAKKGTGPGGGRFPGPNGNRPNGKRGPFPDDASANRYRIGMWVLLAAVLMMFTALSSAYIVRAASAPDWRPLTMPRILWLSTTLLVISSATIEAARRSLRRLSNNAYVRWLSVTASLGAAFLISQLLAWRQLSRQGIYLASNPHSSFFYLLTATHGLHLLGGLFGLSYLLVRKERPAGLAEAKRAAMADAAATYWHFMDGLWIYLFVLLFVWRSL
jgi:cytochrome c oxidase subunit III